MMGKREYYNTSDKIYKLFINHPVMSSLLIEFEIDKDYDPSSSTSRIRLKDVCDFLFLNQENLLITPINYKDSVLMNQLADLYGFIDKGLSPPWDDCLSSSGTSVSTFLQYTVYFFKFAVTDNFYEKHLLDFIPEFDREKILDSDKLKITIESIGRKLDDLEDKISRLKNIYDIDECPDELLDYLGQNIGYEREDFSLNDLSFRELLKNMIEIYKIKGTNYSFSFFFKFLGFEINLKEFYFNKDVENPESFPSVSDSKIEFFLTTKNPLFDTRSKPAKNLIATKNLNDWTLEFDSLVSKTCSNPSKYMRGLETFNNDGVTWHKSPWTYFKTNLIEYQLEPFFDKISLTSSDNDTIMKYIRFLSPTYLFTWINISLKQWIEDVVFIDDFITYVQSTIGDPRPTPQPWPQFSPGAMGVPNHTGPFTIKTSSDIGFEPPYLDYENLQDYLAIYDPNSNEITFNLQNNLNLGGDEKIGSVLKRDGTHIRQPGHPKFISDAHHSRTERILFDSLDINLKNVADLDVEQNWVTYSLNSYPALPIVHSPFDGRTILELDNILFNWEHKPGSSHYWFQLSNNKSFSNVLIDEKLFTNQFIYSGPTLHNNTYYWKVKTMNLESLQDSDPQKWTRWSNIWYFKKISKPYPFDNEVFDVVTEHCIPNYDFSNHLIDTTIDVECYSTKSDIEFIIQISNNISFDLIIREITSSFSSTSISFINGVYYWRFKNKDKNTSEWVDWSAGRKFTVNMPYNL